LINEAVIFEEVDENDVLFKEEEKEEKDIEKNKR